MDTQRKTVTPRIGVNLYVVQGVRGRGAISGVIMGVVPFIISPIVMIILIVLFPEIALWLPRVLEGP